MIHLPPFWLIVLSFDQRKGLNNGGSHKRCHVLYTSQLVSCMDSWGIMAIESKLRPFMHCLESKLNPNKQGQIGIKCRACWHVLCPGTVRASAAAVPSRPMRFVHRDLHQSSFRLAGTGTLLTPLFFFFLRTRNGD
jgi:hypothetical protein